jgi:hypothetical protein
VQVTIRDASDLKALNRQLGQVANGRELRKELTGGIRDVLRPVVGEVKAAYRAGPSKQGGARRKGGSLRGHLARATRMEVRTSGRLAGVRIRVDGRKMPAGMRSLPKYYEGEKRPWRWPVAGNRDVWAQGRARPTFYPTVRPHEDDARRAVDRVLGQVRRKLERSTR